MTDEKWEATLDMIRKNYEIEDEPQGDVENLEGATFQGVIFTCPLGKFKMIREKRPRVLSKKTHFSNRIGSDVQVDYVYSQDDMVDDLKVFKWDEIEMDWVDAKFNI